MSDQLTFQHPGDPDAPALTRPQLASELMRLTLVSAINYTVNEVERINETSDPSTEEKTKLLSVYYFFFSKEYEFTGPENELSLADYQVGMHTAAENFQQLEEPQMANIALGNYHFHAAQAHIDSNSFTEADRFLSVAISNYKSATPIYDPDELLIVEATHTGIRCILHMFQLNIDDMEFEARKGHRQYAKVADLMGERDAPEYNAMMGVGQTLLVVSSFLKQLQES
ncbi:MAG: hypothetical protein AAFU67_17125, partial [Bacteroidota bacterium]